MLSQLSNIDHYFSQGRFVDEFKIIDQLGEGTFGKVFKVRDNLGKVSALKILKNWSVPKHAKKNLEKRFELEFQTGKISHKNLVRSIQYGQFEGAPYFTMEYCPGKNLRAKINSGLSVSDGISIARQILQALNALHQNGKIHRDLKPENVLFKNGKVKLTDFGISGHLAIQLTIVADNNRPKEILGSYAYMAPEQITPKNRLNTILPTIDIFNFGVLCFEMFTNQLPFGAYKFQEDIAGYLERATSGSYSDLRMLVPKLPLKWVSIIEKCLSPKREDRFQNINEVLRFLELKKSIQPLPLKNRSLFLTVLNGEELNQKYNLTNGNSGNAKFSIGRKNPSHQNDVELKEELSNYISRMHATIERHDSNWIIRDGQWNDTSKMWMVSKNGTYLNGEKVDTNGAYISVNDLLTLGNYSLKVN